MQALRKSARRCHVLPGFSFAGYHPDMCYVRVAGQQLDSATGGYHSRLAVAGYLAGLNARDTVALYNRLAFARLGYFAVFEEQVALMTARWARDGIDAEPMLRGWAKAGCFAHTINHPKMIVLLDLARIACERMGVAPDNPGVDPRTLPDRLARGAMHPVFPDIAAALGIAPEGSFSGGFAGEVPRILTPLAFVTDSFGRFADVPQDELHATQGVAQAMDALCLALRVRPRRRLAPEMVLMTHHGTLVRQGPSRGQLSHAALSVAEWQAAYLRVDCARLPAHQEAAGMEGAEIQMAADQRHVVVSRNGAFLGAEAQEGQAGFSRATAGQWEHFVPLGETDLAMLDRLLATDWFVEDTQAIVRREEIGIEAGPVLRFGSWRVDLARHLPTSAAGDTDALCLMLDGSQLCVRRHAAVAAPPAALPEPGRTLGLVGAPVFLAPPALADAADMAWMRRSALAAQALDGAPQATQALLRRQAPTDGRAATLSVRFCGADAAGAAGWAEAAVRLHVLAAVAPPDAAFLVPPDISEEALQGWRALGFNPLNFERPAADTPPADLLWLDNASIAELPADALAGCRARIGKPASAAARLFWQAGIQPRLGAMMAAHGYAAVDAAGVSALAGVALAAQAGWIIGRTGHVPLVFCQPGTRIIELCDQAGFVQEDWVLSAKLGLRHAILPCAMAGNELVADPAKLARVLAVMADMP